MLRLLVLKCCTDPEGTLGCGDDHLGVCAVLDCIGGQFIMESLFEEIAGGGLHQLYQIWAECITVLLKKA